MDGPLSGRAIACDLASPKTIPEDNLESYELVNRAFQQLRPAELNRLLADRLEPTPLAEFLADPRDNSHVKKLTRQEVRADPAFAEDLARALATPPAPAATEHRPEPVRTGQKSNLAAVAMSGGAAILLALLAVLVRKPRPAKRRDLVNS